jgi:hypothetical protein
MALDGTHSQVVTAAGATTVAETAIGTIELPKRSEPWTLHNICGQVVPSVALAAEQIGGYIRMVSPSGDVSPDPSPSKWPVFAQGSHLGALIGSLPCPLHNYEIELLAAGKANLDLTSNLAIACTNAPRWNASVQYGPAAPAKRRAKFCDNVRTTLNAAARAAVGTIALSEKATRIVGIYGSLQQDGVLTAGEELTGYFDLESDDTDLLPSQWLFNEVYSAGLGATIENNGPAVPMPHIVDIPVIGGSDIRVYATLSVAVTNPANVQIFLMYE